VLNISNLSQNKRGRLLTATAVIAVLALAACSSQQNANSSGSKGTASGTTPKSGGNIKMVASAIPATLDPAQDTAYSFTDQVPMSAIYGWLAYEDPKTGATIPQLAQSISSSANFKTWTLKLHSGLKFSDGTPFNAAAVEFNIERDRNPATGSTLQGVASGFSMKVLNSTTITFQLPAPNSGFNSYFSQYFGFIASPTAVKAEGASYATHPVGAGPFKVQSFVPLQSVSLVKNKYFGIYAKGQPYLDGVSISALPSTSQAVAALQTGTAQLAWTNSGQVMSEMSNAGMTLLKNTTQAGAWLDLNTKTAPFNNVKARVAVRDALDTQALANAWTPGNPPQVSLFARSSQFYNAAYNWPASNRAEAQKLFNELAADGTPVKFTFLDQPGFPNLAPYIQSTLDGYKNVQVSVETQLTAPSLVARSQGNYQMTTDGLYSANLEPLGIAAFIDHGATNYTLWNDPTVNSALEAIQQTSDVSLQRKDWGVVEQQLIAQAPVIPAGSGYVSLVYNANSVAGVKSVEFGITPLWNLLSLK
jgi:ABC-type transport system substrate-binding protein